MMLMMKIIKITKMMMTTMNNITWFHIDPHAELKTSWQHDSAGVVELVGLSNVDICRSREVEKSGKGQN